jgi:hypothetical protein
MKLHLTAIVVTLLFAPSVLVTPLWADEENNTVDQEVDAPAQKQPAPSSETAATATTAAGQKHRAGVLDFEAELIEGERKSPDMFLQLQSGTPNLDAILFQRTNFNDFHNLEKHRRPLYRRYVK